QETYQEDLEGGILTIVGLTMANRNNTTKQISEQPSNNHHLRLLVNNGTDNADNNMPSSADNILYFQKTLARSVESLYPVGTSHLQSSSMRRLSHNFNHERRRSLLRTRPTTAKIMAKASRCTSGSPKPLHPAQFDPVRGLNLINLSNLLVANF
ncbi:hypothetical protein LOAG_03878, partial [Loa loa]